MDYVEKLSKGRSLMVQYIWTEMTELAYLKPGSIRAHGQLRCSTAVAPAQASANQIALCKYVCAYNFNYDKDPPVSMFLNASSTFVESKADVSMKERLFFSV